jgi:hypothetical protein
MNKTDYVLTLCAEYLNELNTNTRENYDYYPYFYSALIHKNLQCVDVNFKKENDKSIKDYIIEIYNITNQKSENYLYKKHNKHSMHKAYGGNDAIDGYLASFYHLQEMKNLLEF